MNGLENSGFQLWLTPNYWATFRYTSETCGFGIAAQVSPEHSQDGEPGPCSGNMGIGLCSQGTRNIAGEETLSWVS